MLARTTTLLRTLAANQIWMAQGAERMSSEENVQTVRELFDAFYTADDEIVECWGQYDMTQLFAPTS
jgi:hypothetical protein